MIRTFRSDDLDRVMQLWLDTNILAHNFIDSGYWRGHFEIVKEMLPKADIFVYEQNNEIQAFIGLTGNFVAGLFVSRTFQSKGIGKRLLDTAKDMHGDLCLHVYRKNEAAVHFYLKEGFIIASEQTDENTGEIEFIMIWRKCV